MRKKDSRPQFLSRFAKREAVVAHLKGMNDSEARKALKQMNVMNYGGVKPNAKGFFGKTHPVKCSVKNKTRHTTSAAKRIMRGLA